MPEHFRSELLTVGCYTNPASFLMFCIHLFEDADVPILKMGFFGALK